MEKIVTKSRRTGQTHAMILSMKETINSGGNVGVPGCTDPTDILKRLSSLGVEAQAEVMEKTTPLKAVFEGYEDFVGFEGGEKVQTGYVFSKKEKLKWQTRDEMDQPTNPLQSLRESFTRTAKDMGEHKFDAWLYGVIAGWDDDAYAELAPKHGWTKELVEYNKLLHRNYRKAWNLFMNDINN